MKYIFRPALTFPHRALPPPDKRMGKEGIRLCCYCYCCCSCTRINWWQRFLFGTLQDISATSLRRTTPDRPPTLNSHTVRPFFFFHNSIFVYLNEIPSQYEIKRWKKANQRSRNSMNFEANQRDRFSMDERTCNKMIFASHLMKILFRPPIFLSITTSSKLSVRSNSSLQVGWLVGKWHITYPDRFINIHSIHIETNHLMNTDYCFLILARWSSKIIAHDNIHIKQIHMQKYG